MILQETKISELKLKEAMGNFRPRYEVVGQDAMGSVGGVAILWNPDEVRFEEWVSMPRILSGKCRNIGSKEWILLSGVYGPHIPGERRNFISNLIKVSGLYKSIPWIIGGDFNMIKSLNEKRGGVRRADADMELFEHTIKDQRLVDNTIINGTHTYNNRRVGKHQIAPRLDRFLISEQIISRDRTTGR